MATGFEGLYGGLGCIGMPGCGFPRLFVCGTSLGHCFPVHHQRGVCETEESGQVCEATMPNPTPENMAKPLRGAH